MAAPAKVELSTLLKGLEGLLGASEPHRAASGKVAAIADAATSARECLGGCAPAPESDATDLPAHALLKAVREASKLVDRWAKERRSLRRFSRNGKQWNDSWASATSQITASAVSYCKACERAEAAAESRRAVDGADPPSVTHSVVAPEGATAQPAIEELASTYQTHAIDEATTAHKAAAAQRAEEEEAAAQRAEEEEAAAQKAAAAPVSSAQPGDENAGIESVPADTEAAASAVKQPGPAFLCQPTKAPTPFSQTLSKAPPKHAVTEKDIRTRAYGIWQKSGRSDAVANWYAALQELQIAN